MDEESVDLDEADIALPKPDGINPPEDSLKTSLNENSMAKPVSDRKSPKSTII